MGPALFTAPVKGERGAMLRLSTRFSWPDTEVRRAVVGCRGGVMIDGAKASMERKRVVVISREEDRFILMIGEVGKYLCNIR